VGLVQIMTTIGYHTTHLAEHLHLRCYCRL